MLIIDFKATLLSKMSSMNEASECTAALAVRGLLLFWYILPSSISGSSDLILPT